MEGRPHISTLDWGTSRFSADLVLESGRRPELKSAEKPEVPLVIVELFSIGVEIARRFRYHLLGFWVRWPVAHTVWISESAPFVGLTVARAHLEQPGITWWGGCTNKANHHPPPQRVTQGLGGYGPPPPESDTCSWGVRTPPLEGDTCIWGVTIPEIIYSITRRI